MTWTICAAGHQVTAPFKKVHEQCGAQPRHPSVAFINAITSPTVGERHCYPDAVAAFDALAEYRPYNNTATSAEWCTRAHCPHGCRTGTGFDRPVTQEPLFTLDPGADPEPTGRFRCPACRCEYKPGETPGTEPDRLAGILAGLGLENVIVVPGRRDVYPAAVTAVIPAGNRDAAGWVVLVREPGPAAAGRTDFMAEPLLLALFEDAADITPAMSQSGLTVAGVAEKLRGYL